MLRPLIISVSLLGTLAVSANTVEVATDHYAKRGLDANNAKLAAEIYETLAASEVNTVKKADLLVSQSEALYFLGTRQKSTSDQITVHTKGELAGLKASEILKGDQSNNTLRARALYYYGSNIGKRGLAEGGTEPLKLFKKVLKPKMNELIGLDETVQEYGVYRILGLAYVKVPGLLGGDKEKGLKMIRRGFDATVVEGEDFTVSSNSTTTRYMLFALMKNKYKTEFCALADEFYAFAESERETQDAHNPELIAETQDEVEQFLDPKEDTDQEDIIKYYDKECN
jgi:hypothetical protein